MQIKLLSYPMESVMPVYGNPKARFETQLIKCQERGDSCFTYQIKVENHWGTHVDAPAHFFKRGKKVADYAADFWCFNSPQIINVKLRSGELLRLSHLKKVSIKTDLLLIRSGWYKQRGSRTYSLSGPGIHSESGLYLRKRYPHIRAIGFDWISLSSPLNREMGRSAHRAFLNPAKPGKPILIIEDMDLRSANKPLKQAVAAPWMIRGIDSAPCTVMGFF